MVSALFSFGHLNIYYSARGGVYGSITQIFKKNEVKIEQTAEDIEFGFKNVCLMKNADGQYSASITSKQILKLDANEDYFIYVNNQPCTTVSCEETDIYATYSYTFLNREDGEYLILADDTMTFYFAFYENYSYLYIEVENGENTYQLWNQYFNKMNFKVKIVKVPSSYYSPAEYKKIALMIDGSEYSQATIKKGSDYLLPTNVLNTADYIFNYWQDAEGNKITSIEDVTSDITIHANITEIHKVNLYYGSRFYRTIRVQNSESATLPEINEIYNGFAYRYWQDAEGNKITSVENVTSDMTIYAAPIEIHTITLMKGSTVYQTIEVVDGDNATIPSINIKDGDILYYGWYYSNGNAVEKINGYYTVYSVTSDMTINAGVTNYFTVQLVTDSDIYKSYYVAEGESITFPSINLTTDSCIYTGWLDENGNSITGIDSVTSNRTIIASKINLYTVTYKVDSTTYKTVKVQDGSTLTAPTEPTKNGYQFLYWQDASTGYSIDFSTYTVTQNTTLKAIFQYGFTYSTDAINRVGAFEDDYTSVTELKIINNELASIYKSKDFKELKIKLYFGFLIADYSVADQSTNHYISNQSNTYVEIVITPTAAASQTKTYSLVHKDGETDEVLGTIEATFTYNIECFDGSDEYSSPYFYVKVDPVKYTKLTGDSSSSHDYRISPICYGVTAINLYTV